MESTVIGIQSVESKDINTAKGPGKLFLVKDSLGVEYSTFDKELALAASAYKGNQQPANIGFEISTSVKPNRQGVNTTYTNRYLKSVSPAGEQPFASAVAVSPPVASQAITEAHRPLDLIDQVRDIVAPQAIVAQPSASDRETSIARAVALKAAIDTVVGGVGAHNDIFLLAEEYRGWLQGELSVSPLVAASFGDFADPAGDIPFLHTIDGLGN